MESPLVLPLVTTFVVAVIAVYWTMRRAASWGLVDEANHRSLHSGRKPRAGGIGVLLAIVSGWVLAAWFGYPPANRLILFVAMGAVAVVSFLDDLWDMPPLPRVTVHLLAGLSLLAGGFGLGTLAVPGASVVLGSVASGILTVLFVVWFINLYNFMDGMDGFAGGMTLFGFGALAVLGSMASEPSFATAAGVVAAAAAGFLLFNFPPARVFLGDVGSAPLGFLVATFGLWADAAEIAPIWVTVMVFSPFFLDATVTAGRRVLRRERFWEAHKSHYYQRSVQAGWSHRQTVLAEYALMLGCGVSAILVVSAEVWVQWAAIVGWLLVYLGCVLGVHSRERGK